VQVRTDAPSRTRLKVLDNPQVDEFVRDGYTIVRNAFSRETAEAIRDFLWLELTSQGVRRDSPSTWTKRVVHLAKVFHDEPFASAWSNRLYGALDDVLGEGRYDAPVGLGWWPVSFPNFDTPPWSAPTEGWHIDGIQFHHRINSADQGLLPLFMLSDISPGGGGTAVSAGSHVITARILAAAEPEGLDDEELTKRVLEYPIQNVRELTGNAGDVALVHPFLLHARSPNTGQAVRFICNPCIPLKAPLDLNRQRSSEYSPVELAIVNSIR